VTPPTPAELESRFWEGRPRRLAESVLLCVVVFLAALTINGMAPQFLFLGGTLTGICTLAAWLVIWERG
jgi:hypothetical protein